jgi:hypothetical protein
MTVSPSMYQALAIRKGLQFYMQTGMKINRMYTPKNMLRTATNITGVTFKMRQYQEAVDALTQWIDDRMEGDTNVANS